MRHLTFVLSALTLLAGCEYLPTGSTADTGTTADTGSEVTDGPEAPSAEGPSPGWSVSWHPCVGHRTDTLWFDDRDSVWVGCGSTTEGTGLYLSEDGGLTWMTIAGYFDTFRVSSISRSADGLLYVAGIDTTGVERVVSMDEDYAVSPVFSAGGQVWNTFHVGTFRRNSEGVAIAESLTGTELVYRFGDDRPWADGYGWWSGSESYQILDLVLHDDLFYAVGSTIGQPPYVFLPPPSGLDPANGVQFSVLRVADFDGELWGLDVDRGGVVTAGVDQDRDVGFVFWSGPDPYDLASWGTLDVSTLLPSEPTWMRGACRDGDVLVAVGEYSRRGAGIVLRSDDAGLTWQDVTPTDVGDVPSLHRCEVFDRGAEVVIAGAEGVVLTYAR